MDWLPLPHRLLDRSDMDAIQVTQWMARLYKPGQTFELVAVKDGLARRKTFTWATGLGISSAIQTFEDKGWNVYASAMPLEQQATGTYDRLWVDQDDPKANLSGTTSEWPRPNTFVVTSWEPEQSLDYRWQGIWKLNTPISAEDAKYYMRIMADQLGADGSVSDARRVLRVPGVINAKRNQLTYSMDAFTVDYPSIVADFNLPTVTPVQKLLTANVRSAQTILGEWLAGFGEGERNQKAYICARFLRSCDVEMDDATAIVAVGARRCNPPMDDQEVVNAVRSAYSAK